MSKLPTVSGLPKLKMPKMPGFNLSNHFKNTNSILIVCVVILILIALIGYKFSSCFSPCSMFGGACPKKSSNDASTKDTPKCKIVTPQCLLGGLATPGAPVLVVNVLSEKMPVFIGVGAPDESRSLSKAQFEAILKENNDTLPKEVGLVFLMCAGWSCGAAKGYCDELAKRGVDVSRVVDYAGGLNEWCMYNKLNKNVFKLFHLRKESENRIAELSEGEVNELLANTSHGYNTNTLIQEDSGIVSELCKNGIELPSVLVPPPPTPTTEGLPNSQDPTLGQVPVQNGSPVENNGAPNANVVEKAGSNTPSE